MGAFGVVVGHPVLDHPTGLEAITDFFEIDRFLFQAAPQPFDDDVVEISAPGIHWIRTAASVSVVIQADPKKG